jgi:hypothetical protein
MQMGKGVYNSLDNRFKARGNESVTLLYAPLLEELE